MRISFKFILWAWSVLFLVLGLMFYGAYNKLEPKSFIALLNEQTIRNYPGSKLDVGAVDYRFSLDFNLSLKNILLTRSGKVLTSIHEIELKVPWWLILFNRGRAQINISDLTIFVDEQGGPSVKASSSPSVPTSAGATHNVKVTLPAYLIDANYTVRAKNIHVKDMNSDRRYFTLSKLLVREFQYGRNSAFELNLPIEINHKSTQYQSELWLFGDITPNLAQWNLQFRGEFKTREASDKFQLDDLIIDGKASFNPAELDIISNIILLKDREQIGSGRINAKHDNLKIHIDFNGLPTSYLSLLGEEIKNSHRIKTEGVAQGMVDFSREFNQTKGANLSGSLSFDGSFALGPNDSFPGKWKMTFENTKWETSFISPKGEVSFFHRAFLDFEKGSVAQYSQELGFKGVDYKLVTLPVIALGAFRTLPDETYFSSQVSFKKSPHGDKLLDGIFRYGLSPDKKYYQADLTDGASSLKLDFQDKHSLAQINIDAKEFEWLPFLTFLEPHFNLEEGKLNGKLQGNWQSSWQSGTWLVNMKFEKSKKITGEVAKFYEDILSVFELDATAFTNFKWNLSASKDILKLSSLSLESADLAIISGTLSRLVKTKSALSLSYPKNKIWKPVTKEVTENFWNKEAL